MGHQEHSASVAVAFSPRDDVLDCARKKQRRGGRINRRSFLDFRLESQSAKLLENVIPRGGVMGRTDWARRSGNCFHMLKRTLGRKLVSCRGSRKSRRW